jgi:hypothetical protein
MLTYGEQRVCDTFSMRSVRPFLRAAFIKNHMHCRESARLSDHKLTLRRLSEQASRRMIDGLYLDGVARIDQAAFESVLRLGLLGDDVLPQQVLSTVKRWSTKD